MSVGSLRVELELDDDQFTTRIIRTGDALRGLESRIVSTITGVNNLDRSVGASAASIGLWTVALDRAAEGIFGLGESLGHALGSIVETNAQIERTTILLTGLSKASADANNLGGMTQGAADQAARLGDAQSGVKAILSAEGSAPFGVTALTDTFVKLKTAGMDPLNGSFKALNDAIAAFGGDDSRLQRAGYAIQEMAGRGVISLQNLRRQLGQDIPGAVELMARSMEITVANLDQAVTRGTLDSKVALSLMLDEFERTFGGAAQQQMQTFSGQMAVLSAQMQRLSLTAGGMNPGTPADLSFYKTLIGGVQELNQYLKSPDVNNYAISVNDSLRGLTQSAIAVGKAMEGWGGTLLSIGGVLLTFVVTLKTATSALELFGSVGRWMQTSESVATLAGNLGNLTRFIGSMGAAAGTAIAPAVSWFVTMEKSILSAGASLGGFAGLAVSAVAPMTSLIAALGILAIPVAIIAGITAIVSSVHELQGAAELAGTALNRMREGDNSQVNTANASEELKQLQAKSDLLQRQATILKELKSGNESHIDELQNIGGYMGNTGVKSPVDVTPVMADGVAPTAIRSYTQDGVQKALDETVAKAKQAAADVANYTAQIAAAPMRVAQDAASRAADADIAALQTKFQSLEAAYIRTNAGIESARENLKPTDTAGKADLNSQYMASIKTLYDGEQALVQQEINQINSLIAAGGNKMSDTEVTEYGARLNKLQGFLDEMVRRQAEAIARTNAGMKIDDGDKQYDAALKSANTLIETMTESTAKLAGSMNEVGSNVSRVNAMLADGGRLSKLSGNEELVAQLLAVAAALDKETAAKKQFDEFNKAQNKIDLGLDKAIADLSAYTSRLTDPNMPESERSFVQFQNEMAQELDRVWKNADGAAFSLGTLQQAMQATSRAATAVDIASFATAVKQLGDADKSAAGARLQNDTPAQRVVEARKQITDRYNSIRTRLSNATPDALAAGNVTPDQQKAMLEKLDQDQKDELAAAGRRYDQGAARAAAPGDNAVEQLKSRLAALKDEMTGGTGVLAAWTEKVKDSTKYSQAQAEAILATAAQVDKLTEANKLAREASQAIEKLKTDQVDNQDKEADLVRLQSSGKLLDIEKNILDYRVKQDALVNKVAKQKPAGDLTQGSIDGQTAEARKIAEANVTSYTDQEVAERISYYNKEAQTIKLSGDDSASHNRQRGMQALTDEQARIDALIQKTQWGDEQKKAAEDSVANYISAKRDELEKKTESQLQKLADQWSQTTNQIDSFTAQSMSQFADTLATQLATGKANWKSFSDYVIQQLSRIVTEQALAPLIKLLGGGESGAGGIGGLVGGLFGKLFGGGGAAAADPFAGAGALSTPFAHGGAIIGSESSFTRSISSAVFGSAPRFHTGVGPDEVGAVIQKGEGVFTAGQMAAIGDMNHSYGYVEKAMSALVSTLSSVPTLTAPNTVNQSGSYGTTAPTVQQGSGANKPITVNMNNQSGTQLNAMSAMPRFDGEQMILDVVIKNAQQPGQLRNLLTANR